MITIKNIKKQYGDLKVLDDISMDVAAGEIVSIVGASGAGKTTLLQIVGTLDRPDTGEILIDNQGITQLKKRAMAKFRNEQIGFIFQFHQLLPEFTALENVCLPGFLGARYKSDVTKKAKELLDYLGLADQMNKKPVTLSGGEQQRTAVARALINSPRIVLADEPSGNLDSENAQALHELFFKLRKDMNQTFLIVTHNEHLANLADRSVEMQDGKIISN